MNALRDTLDARRMTLRQWSAIGVCMALNMIDGFDVLVMAFTAASVSADWKINGARLGILLSAGLVGMAAGSLFIAPWADRFGRKPMILGCLVVCGSGMVASSFVQTETQLAVMRVLTGLGVGGILACSNVIASEYASRRWRGLAVSLQSTGYALGATIGGTIAIWLLSHHGWRSVFLFGGFATFCVATLVLWRLPESLDFLLARRPAGALVRINRIAVGLGLPPLSALPPEQASAREQGNRVTQLLSPPLLRPTLLVWSSFFLVMFGFYFVMSWTPRLLAASGLTAAQGVTGGVLLSLGGIFGTALLGLLAAKFRMNRVLACVLLTSAALLGLVANRTGSAGAAYVLAFAVGVFVNASVAGLYAIAPMVYGPGVRATGMGLGIGIGRIGAILSPLVAGVLIDGQWKPAQLYVGYGVVFIGAAVIVLLHRLAAPTGPAGSTATEPPEARGLRTSGAH